MHFQASYKNCCKQRGSGVFNEKFNENMSVYYGSRNLIYDGNDTFLLPAEHNIWNVHRLTFFVFIFSFAPK